SAVGAVVSGSRQLLGSGRARRVLAEPAVDVLGAVADRATRQLDRRQLAAARPAQDRLRRDGEQVGDLAGGEEPFAHAARTPSARSSSSSSSSGSASQSRASRQASTSRSTSRSAGVSVSAASR